MSNEFSMMPAGAGEGAGQPAEWEWTVGEDGRARLLAALPPPAVERAVAAVNADHAVWMEQRGLSVVRGPGFLRRLERAEQDRSLGEPERWENKGLAPMAWDEYLMRLARRFPELCFRLGRMREVMRSHKETYGTLVFDAAVWEMSGPVWPEERPPEVPVYRAQAEGAAAGFILWVADATTERGVAAGQQVLPGSVLWEERSRRAFATWMLHPHFPVTPF